MYRTGLKLFTATILITPSVASADGGLGSIAGIIAVFAFSFGLAAIVPGLILFYQAIKGLKDLPEIEMSVEDAKRKKIRRFILPVIFLALGAFFMIFGFENV